MRCFALELGAVDDSPERVLPLDETLAGGEGDGAGVGASLAEVTVDGISGPTASGGTGVAATSFTAAVAEAGSVGVRTIDGECRAEPATLAKKSLACPAVSRCPMSRRINPIKTGASGPARRGDGGSLVNRAESTAVESGPV